MEDDDGDMAYADLNEEGELVASEEKVGQPQTSKRKKNLNPPKEKRCKKDICKSDEEKSYSPNDIVLDQETLDRVNCSGKGTEECGLAQRRTLSIHGDHRRLQSSTGTLMNLVILMRFSDHKNRVLPTKANYETLMNTDGVDSTFAPSSSVKTFYKKATHGKLTVQSTVVDWITLPESESYYANGQSG